MGDKNNDVHNKQSNEAYENWTDVPLITDEITSKMINERCYEAIVITREFAHLWNLDKRIIDFGVSSKGPLELNQPFWVDDKNVAHVIPSEILSRIKFKNICPLDRNISKILNDRYKKTLYTMDLNRHLGSDTPLETNNCEIENGATSLFKDEGNEAKRWIRVVHGNNLYKILEINPLSKLLLVDQYRIFLEKKYFENNLIDFVFTGAPVSGFLSEVEEKKFYNQLLKRTKFSYRRDEEVKKENSSSIVTTRNCHKIWSLYIPSIEYIENFENSRWLNYHLTSSTGNTFFRNIVSSILENENRMLDELHDDDVDMANNYVEKKNEEIEDKNVPFPQSNDKMSIVIKLYFKRNDIPSNLEDSESRQLIKLYFKKFSAFVVRLNEICQRLKYSPKIFWFSDNSNGNFIDSIYSEILREHVLGRSLGLLSYDRYLKIDNFFERYNLIDETCNYSIRTPSIKDRDTELLGKMNRYLIRTNFFHESVFLLPDDNFIVKHSSSLGGEPVYKLKNFEY